VRVAAVDFGATSVRVAVVDLDAAEPVPEIVHRYLHAPVRFADGSLRWDWDRLAAETERGLATALEGGPLASIGVDTWGVDYGLLGSDGKLLSPPFSYRDGRTAGWQAVADTLGRDRLYRTSGIQLMAVNTVFQLAVHPRDELERAAGLLMLPELLVHHLTGSAWGEVTSASTTALVDIADGSWSAELLSEIGVDPGLFPPIARAGTPAGAWRGVPVHLVAGHDTASAVAARAPGAPASAAFVATGSWFLVGVERDAADVSDAARRANFSNEAGALGGFRFLKNVTGLWLLEQCRAQWGAPRVEELFRAAGALAAGGPVVDPNDQRFADAVDMESELRAAAGLRASAGRDAVVRCILDSVAAATSRVLDELRTVLGEPVTRVDVLGGGGRSELLVHLIGEACGVEVLVGPAEATALGNALVQARALGVADVR